MTAPTPTSYRRFARNADKALLGGVCAGVADYFGFNLRATRLLFVIAFFVAMPVPLIIYIAIVLLVPAESSRYRDEVIAEREIRRRRRRMSRKERKQADEEERLRAVDALQQRRQALDQRLARIEKYVTSSRYTLDREFSNL
jgi:phage shock protein C